MKSDDRGDFVILPLKQGEPEDNIRVRLCFTCRETFPGDHESIFITVWQIWGRKLLRHFFLASDFEGDNCSLKTLKTLPEIYTSVCFESQTVASNYQEFANKNTRRLGYGHKDSVY